MRLALALGLLLPACAIETSGLAGDASAGGDAGVATDARGGIEASVRDGAQVDARAGDAWPAEDATTPEDGGPPIVDAGPYDVIDLPCEAGALVGAMTTVADDEAFGGAAAMAPVGSAPDWFADGASVPPDRVEIPVTLRGGDYDVWIYFYTQDAAHDALYAGFGAADMRRFYHRTWGTYQWRRGNDDDLRALHFAGLDAGSYTLMVGLGETEVRCDRVIVTNDPTLAPPEPP